MASLVTLNDWNQNVATSNRKGPFATYAEWHQANHYLFDNSLPHIFGFAAALQDPPAWPEGYSIRLLPARESRQTLQARIVEASVPEPIHPEDWHCSLLETGRPTTFYRKGYRGIVLATENNSEVWPHPTTGAKFLVLRIENRGLLRRKFYWLRRLRATGDNIGTNFFITLSRNVGQSFNADALGEGLILKFDVEQVAGV